MAFDVSNALIMPSITDGMLETKQAVQQMASQKQANALRQQQADQQSVAFGQEQDDRQNAVNLATAQHVLASSNPRLALQQAASADPHVAQFVSSMTQDHGVDISNTSDDDVRGMAQTAVDHFSSLLRKGPPPKDPGIVMVKKGEGGFKQNPDTKAWEQVISNPDAPEAETFSGQPTAMVINNKPVMTIRGSKGTVKVIDGAAPYNAPSQAGQGPPSGYKFNNDGTLAVIPGGPADDGSPTNTRTRNTQVTGLRKEFDNLPEVKNYSLVIPTYQRALTAPDTRAGDLSMIYALGKIFDPGSVVREGELILSKDAAPIVQKMVSSINSQLTGKGALSPDTRAQIREAMRGQVESLRAQYDMKRDQFSSYAQDFGADSFKVVGKHPGGEGAQKPGALNGAAGMPDDIAALLQKHGKR